MNELNFFSSTDDVQHFLKENNFHEVICEKFSKFDGRALLGADSRAVEEMCGNTTYEGYRLVGILNATKNPGC
jgi:hypothetical protein